MASAVQLSEIATQYPAHENYTLAVSMKLNELMNASNNQDVSFFIRSICHDPHFRGVIAQNISVLEFITAEEVTVLSEELSSLTTMCMECLGISFASCSLATGETAKEEGEEIPPFATLYLRQDEYVQAILQYISYLQPLLEADKARFFALVDQIQHDVYFCDVVAAYPLLLQFMLATDDTSR